MSILARKQTISVLRLDEIKLPKERVISVLLKISAKYRTGSKALEATGKGFLNQLFFKRDSFEGASSFKTPKQVCLLPLTPWEQSFCSLVFAHVLKAIHRRSAFFFFLVFLYYTKKSPKYYSLYLKYGHKWRTNYVNVPRSEAYIQSRRSWWGY